MIFIGWITAWYRFQRGTGIVVVLYLKHMVVIMCRVCGHCHRRLSEKALKEHERLYLDDGVWLTESKIERGVSSSDELSEPITLSDPPDPDEAVEMSSDEQLLVGDFDDDDDEVSRQASKLHIYTYDVHSPSFFLCT